MIFTPSSLKMEMDAVKKAYSILENFAGKKGVLVQALHAIQEEFGFLPKEALSVLSDLLSIPLSQVYGVASFYKCFYFSPRGRNIVKVCVGTACHVRGAGRLLSAAEEELGLKSGQTAPDLSFTLESVGCVGCCALAPVVVINEKVHGGMSTESVKKVIEKIKDEDKERQRT
jgi:NADH-quinone oxidoreductase subunit E